MQRYSIILNNHVFGTCFCFKLHILERLYVLADVF